jgi:polyhydroxyalkanoate synthesis regulator phasin
VIKQGGIAKTAINGVNETIDSMINRSNFLAADWFAKGEMAEE